jgi:hypothetical protein
VLPKERSHGQKQARKIFSRSCVDDLKCPLVG